MTAPSYVFDMDEPSELNVGSSILLEMKTAFSADRRFTGGSFLQNAIWRGDFDMLWVLLTKYSCDPNQLIKGFDDTPLVSPLSLCVRMDSHMRSPQPPRYRENYILDPNSTHNFDVVKCMKVLLEHGATTVGQTLVKDLLMMHKSVFEITSMLMLKMLLEAGADARRGLHSAICIGNTPFEHRAALCVDAVTMLLRYGADPNRPTGVRALTPLHMVMKQVTFAGARIPVCQKLLAAGAHVNMPDDDGRSPLCYAVACQAVDSVSVCHYLLDERADPNITYSAYDDEGYPRTVSCLFDAAENRVYSFQILKLLLSYGADPNLPVDNHAGLGTTVLEEMQVLYEGSGIDLKSQRDKLMRAMGHASPEQGPSWYTLARSG